MVNKPLVSVIILNWNGDKIIRECLSSVLNVNYNPLEIIVVDNASQDKSIEILQSFGSRIKTISLDKNSGFAKGMNIGAGKSKGKYVAFLNNDLVVDKEWLGEPIAFLESHPTTGIISSRQMHYSHREHVESLFHTIIRGFTIIEYGADDVYEPIKNSYVLSANGASMICSKKLFEILNGFDETYFAYYEDSDFCLRAFLAGWDCAFIPSAVVYHMKSYSFGKEKLLNYYGERNRFYFIINNYPIWYILKYIPVLVIKELLAVCRYIRAIKIIKIYFRSRFDAMSYIISLKWTGKKLKNRFIYRYSRYKELLRLKYIECLD